MNLKVSRNVRAVPNRGGSSIHAFARSRPASPAPVRRRTPRSRVRTAAGASATVASRHGSDGLQDIKGLTKYADEAVDDAGNINGSYWGFFGPIIHGRRAEIEFLAKNADAVPGTHVAFEVVKKEAKKLSDVDAFLYGAAVSIKRQGKTLDKWVKEKGEDWLKKYMTKVMTGGGKLPPSGQLIFRTGKELPSPETQKLLRDIVENSPQFKRPGFTVSFEVFEILPPPNIN